MKNFSKKKLIATDMDGTFIGNDRAMYKLLEIIEKNSFILCYSTGRHLKSIKDFCKMKGIRGAKFNICLVGTQLYIKKGQRYYLDRDWQKFIEVDWHRERIVKLLKDIKGLSLQDEEWQSPLKLSCFLTENINKNLNKIKRRLKDKNLKAKVIFSSDKFLDFLPKNSGKGNCLKFISKKYQFKKENIIVCGDSGNDIDMFEAGFKGIAVGNSQNELKEYNNKNLYHAKKNFASGIIEGLKYYNFLQ